jgi:hypothetical protein
MAPPRSPGLLASGAAGRGPWAACLLVVGTWYWHWHAWPCLLPESVTLPVAASRQDLVQPLYKTHFQGLFLFFVFCCKKQKRRGYGYGDVKAGCWGRTTNRPLLPTSLVPSVVAGGSSLRWLQVVAAVRGGWPDVAGRGGALNF